MEGLARRAIRVAVTRMGASRIKDVMDEVLAVRTFTEDGLRAVQLTLDELLVNYLRGDGTAYPGFAVLLDEAMAHCRLYAECYLTIGILQATLHSVDLGRNPGAR